MAAPTRLLRTGSAAWRTGALAAAAVLAGTVAWYGCNVYGPSLLVAAAPDASSDAMAPGDASDAGDAAGEAIAPSCPTVSVPPAPAADDPSDAGDQTFVVALHTIDVGLEDGGNPLLGYDLDHVYTCCDAGPESCKAAVTGTTHCDTPQGRDNSGGQLLATLASLDSAQFNSTTVSQRLQNGTYSVLLQVLHYNGQPNDTSVTAALYASDGVAGDVGAKWNGSDSWTVDDAFVVAPDASPLLPNHLDGKAYVANGTLVMHVSFPLSIGTGSTGSFSIALTAGLLTASIVPAGAGQFGLQNGQIAGRWNVTDMLAAIQTLDVAGTGVCQGSSFYTFVKQEICQYADIMTDPTLDQTGATCNALSLGIGFTADPALMGRAVAGAKGKPPCEAGPPDDCTSP